MSNLKMLNSTKYLYKLTLIKCSYEVRSVTPAKRFQRVFSLIPSKYSQK